MLQVKKRTFSIARKKEVEHFQEEKVDPSNYDNSISALLLVEAGLL